MNSQRRWLLHNVKILAVCGAMLYFASGLSKMTSGAEKVNEGSVIETVNKFHGETVMSDVETEEFEIEERQRTVEPVEDEVTEEFNEDEQYMLAKIAMAEAESEDTEGKALVINVVLNRVNDKDFPNSIKEVILQERNGTYQFSVTQENGRWWTVEPDDECFKALKKVINEQWDGSHGALYFESRSKSDWHQKNLEFLFQHGHHYFYKNRENS